MSAISILFLLNSTAVHPGPSPPVVWETRIEDCDPTNNFGMHSHAADCRLLRLYFLEGVQ